MQQSLNANAPTWNALGGHHSVVLSGNDPTFHAGSPTGRMDWVQGSSIRNSLIA
jgi:hypothetical protein